jgi:predicted RND superfamily exporter protein
MQCRDACSGPSLATYHDSTAGAGLSGGSAVLFVILFALSTDYEVFMLSRVKEYYHATGNNQEAVAAGLQRTGAIITAAGLILVGTFGSLALARIVVLKEIGLGLAIGVLLDSTIVRGIVVPATMCLMGRANWWMPAWLKKIVREVRESAAAEPVPAVVTDVSEELMAPALATAGAPCKPADVASG